MIIANKYFNNNIDYIFCDTWNLEEVLDNDFENYENIYICDLPIGSEVIKAIEIIEPFVKEYIRKFKRND